MNIAIDVREAYGRKNGKGQFVFNVVKNLLDADKSNRYFLYSKKSIPEFCNLTNAEMILIKTPGFFWHFATIKNLQHRKIDIFFSPTSYIIPSFLPERIKSIFVVHDLAAILFPKMHKLKAVILEKFLLKRASKKAKAIIAVSKNTKMDIKKFFNDFFNKTHVIPCSASDSFQKRNQEEIQLFKQKNKLPQKFILAVGTLSPRKNYLNLIKAFKIVNNLMPETVLVIIGQKGWKYKEIFNLINREKLKNKIQIFSNADTEELVLFYNSAEVFVFPSIYEGFGIPPLEAMKCGCPVVVSNVSSIPEVVGSSALKIDPKNSQQMANAILNILKDEGTKTKLIKKGFERASLFSWKHTSEKILQLFEKHR